MTKDPAADAIAKLMAEDSAHKRSPITVSFEVELAVEALGLTFKEVRNFRRHLERQDISEGVLDFDNPKFHVFPEHIREQFPRDADDFDNGYVTKHYLYTNYQGLKFPTISKFQTYQVENVRAFSLRNTAQGIIHMLEKEEQEKS